MVFDEYLLKYDNSITSGQECTAGTVKYVGKLSGKPGTWVGVALDEPGLIQLCGDLYDSFYKQLYVFISLEIANIWHINSLFCENYSSSFQNLC